MPGDNEGEAQVQNVAMHVPLPPNINVHGDMKSGWTKFKQLWDSYEILTGLDTKYE
jgi:hypothetical protein